MSQYNFTFAELAREMGYSSTGKAINEKIRKAIEILTDTTIYNRYTGGLYDITKKNYITNVTEGFHIVEHFHYKSYKEMEEEGVKRKAPQKMKESTAIKLNSFFYKSIRNNYFKYFDYEIFKSLNSGISRKLFLILNKWKNSQPYLKIKYETLYERIPLESSMEGFRKKELIKKAGKELLQTGFVMDIEYSKDLIRYNFEENVMLEGETEIASYKQKYNSLIEVIEAFENYGFSTEEVQEILAKYLNDLSYLKALLRYVYIQNVYDKLDTNLKGYLQKGLKDKYKLDKKYYNDGEC